MTSLTCQAWYADGRWNLKLQGPWTVIKELAAPECEFRLSSHGGTINGFEGKEATQATFWRSAYIWPKPWDKALVMPDGSSD